MTIIMELTEKNGDVIRRIELDCYEDDAGQAAQMIVDFAQTNVRRSKELAP